MNPAEYDWKALAYFASGGGVVLLGVCAILLATVRELWIWAKGHLGTFGSINLMAKDGKIQLGATIEDKRGKVAEAPKPESQNGVEHEPQRLNLS